jgi:hypothetical protein
VLVGAGLVEGFRGRPVGLYTGTVLLCFSGQDALQNAIVYSGFWIAWLCAVAALRRSGDAPLRGPAAVIASAYVGVVAIKLASHINHPFMVVAGFAALPLGLFVPDGRPGTGARQRWMCVLTAGLAAGIMEYAARSTGGSYTDTSSWAQHWQLPPGMSPLKVVFSITGGLYAAAGFLLGWLIHNLCGGAPLRSRLLRAFPLLFALAALPQVFFVPGIESFALRVGRAVNWSQFLVMDILVLAVLLLVVVTLLAIEFRRTRVGTLQEAT